MRPAPGRYLFIDSELAMAAGDSRAAWLTSWGFDAAIEPTEAEGFIDGVPDMALPGMSRRVDHKQRRRASSPH